MKQTLNTIINGFGYMCIMLGFVVFVGAGGASDLGANMAFVFSGLWKGIAILFIGLGLAGWRL